MWRSQLRVGRFQRADRRAEGEQRGGREEGHPPGHRRESENENQPKQKQPRLGLLTLRAVPGGKPRRALLRLDQIRILALRARAEDAGERAKRAMSKPAPWLPPSVQVEEILEASLPGVYADQN